MRRCNTDTVGLTDVVRSMLAEDAIKAAVNDYKKKAAPKE